MDAMSRPDGDIDLRELLILLWRHRWLIFVLSFVGGGGGACYALWLPAVYSAEALIQVRQEQTPTRSFGGLPGPLDDLVNVASMGPGSGADRARVLATLKSRLVIQGFIRDNNLLSVFYESLWDPEQKRWTVESKHEPTLWDGYKYFSNNILKVSEDKKTWLVTVAVEWRDPQVAAVWASDIVARTNRHLREQAILEGERQLDYLKQQLRQTGLLEVQGTVYKLMELELNRLMLAKGSDEFALRTIDPAQPPRQRIRPNRRAIALSGLILGAGLGLLLVFLKYLALPFARPGQSLVRNA